MKEEINLLDVYRVLIRRRYLIFFLPVIFTGITLFAFTFSPPQYKSVSTLLPQGEDELGQASGFSALGALAALSSSSDQSKIMALLTSRTLAERVIDESGLIAHYLPEAWDKNTNSWKTTPPQPSSVLKPFRENYLAEYDVEKQIVRISFDSTDAHLSQKVLHSVLKTLNELINETVLDSAKRNRIFLESQLIANDASLLRLGIDLSKYYQQNSISSNLPFIDVKLSIENFKLNSSASKSGSQKSIKDVVGITQKMQETKTDELVSAVPHQIYLEYLNLKKTTLLQVSGFLYQQYEVAKINETRETLSFQIVDMPSVSGSSFWPDYKKIFAIALVVSFFFVLVCVFILEHIKAVRLELTERG